VETLRKLEMEKQTEENHRKQRQDIQLEKDRLLKQKEEAIKEIKVY